MKRELGRNVVAGSQRHGPGLGDERRIEAVELVSHRVARARRGRVAGGVHRIDPEGVRPRRRVDRRCLAGDA